MDAPNEFWILIHVSVPFAPMSFVVHLYSTVHSGISVFDLSFEKDRNLILFSLKVAGESYCLVAKDIRTRECGFLSALVESTAKWLPSVAASKLLGLHNQAGDK